MKRYVRKFEEDGKDVLKKLGYAFKDSDIKRAFKLSSVRDITENLHVSSPSDPNKTGTILKLIAMIKVVKDGRDPDKGGFGAMVSIIKELEKKNISKEDLQEIGDLFRSKM
jgi:hypothetical protein